VTIPETQHAIQLVGPDKLEHNRTKPVIKPSGYQILVRVEATGLCFSDLKLLKQFTSHPRKGRVISGIDPSILEGYPSYVPGDKPAVPGHESVVRIIAIGDKVKNHRVGERCLVQTDYRSLITEAKSNAAFGYNMEGGLQEYVIIDERIARDALTGERFLIPVTEERSRSAICLVEPWACVEDSYLNEERSRIKPGGKLLVTADSGRTLKGLKESFHGDGGPSKVTAIVNDVQLEEIVSLNIPLTRTNDIDATEDYTFDDVVYFGSDKKTIERLNSKLAPGCIINIVTGGKSVNGNPRIGIGRIHYGMTRWVGTVTDNASDGYSMIPESCELRKGDTCHVIGAGGPMGQMHVIRNICSGIDGISITASDLDEVRLKSLALKAQPLADENGVKLDIVSPNQVKPEIKFSYTALMVPVPKLLESSIRGSSEDSLINIFAGIPAYTIHEIDINSVIDKRCFMLGTSGSVLRDMKVVLAKIEGGALDTNCSVDAVSGMAGAIDGIRAVENRTLHGKIIVYPQLHDVPLIPLSEMNHKFPSVARELKNGQWTKSAEMELLKVNNAG